MSQTNLPDPPHDLPAIVYGLPQRAAAWDWAVTYCANNKCAIGAVREEKTGPRSVRFIGQHSGEPWSITYSWTAEEEQTYMDAAFARLMDRARVQNELRHAAIVREGNRGLIVVALLCILAFVVWLFEDQWLMWLGVGAG